MCVPGCLVRGRVGTDVHGPDKVRKVSPCLGDDQLATSKIRDFGQVAEGLYNTKIQTQGHMGRSSWSWWL